MLIEKKMRRLSAIVAMAENRVIGKDNKLPWHLPADLKHFKYLTIGHPILMGRKTYESIGKPLPERDNIILTHDATYCAPGCVVVTNIDEALESATSETNDEVFIIGGAQIYRELLPRIERIYLTIVHADFAGDAFFPELNPEMWQEKNREKHLPDEKNAYAYSFITLERVK